MDSDNGIGKPNFEQRLRYGKFTVEVERVRGRLKKGGPRHTIFLGHNGLA